MESSNSYVYFVLSGEDFDPNEVSKLIGIRPTESLRKGDKGKYKPVMHYSYWKLSTEEGKEYIDLYKLIEEITSILYEKIDAITEIKKQFNLRSILQIVMDIDVNQKQSTPALGFKLKTIEFIYKTQTEIDIDIYRFDSSK
jgi:hypothetical protein